MEDQSSPMERVECSLGDTGKTVRLSEEMLEDIAVASTAHIHGPQRPRWKKIVLTVLAFALGFFVIFCLLGALAVQVVCSLS